MKPTKKTKNTDDKKMRISRALALAGVDSRRKCEEHVLSGDVKVNGKVMTNLATRIDVSSDMVTFRGNVLVFENYIYYLLFKPKGYTTTAKDKHAKKTVYELLPHVLVSKSANRKHDRTRVFPVGRLDRESSGLLLFTNDGEMANRLLHPRYGVLKVYEVRLHRPFDARDRKRLLDGIRLKEGLARIQQIKSITKRVVHVWIQEGKKREIRRMFAHLDYGVQELCRIAFGPFGLGRLQPGYGRYLTKADLKKLDASSTSSSKTPKKKSSNKRSAPTS